MRTFLIFGNSTKEKVDDMYNVDRTDVEVERQIARSGNNRRKQKRWSIKSRRIRELQHYQLIHFCSFTSLPTASFITLLLWYSAVNL